MQQYIQYGPPSGVPITLGNMTSVGIAGAPVILTSGRQSAIIDNMVSGANLYPDYLASAIFTCGTSPLASSIELWVFPQLTISGNNVIVLPQYFGQNDANVQLDSLNQKYNALRLAAVVNVDAVSNRSYSVAPFSVAALFGGVCPAQFGFFVTHNTWVNLSNVSQTSGNAIWVTPVTYVLN